MSAVSPKAAEPQAIDRETIIAFVPYDARIKVADAHGHVAASSVSMRLKLKDDEDVRLPNDRSLRDSDWSMYLVEGNAYNEWSTARGGVGVMSSSRKRSGENSVPHECYISAALKPDKFRFLLSLLQGGRVPDMVYITTLGMTYGWDPDGRDKVWDLSVEDTLPVSEIDFRVPITTPTASVDLAAIETRVTEAIRGIQGTLKVRWGWLYALLVLVFLAVVVHR